MDILQKFVNDRFQMVDESIQGFLKCYHSFVEMTPSPRAIRYKDPSSCERVGIVAVGGWGHDPAFMGYLGKNMLDAVAIGETFIPPSSEACLEAFRAAYKGKEVLCICGNYCKDIENAMEAARIVKAEGIEVRFVLVDDDVGSPDPSSRRGMTGEIFVWKMAGAASAKDYSIDEIIRVCQQANRSMGTIGVGLASCFIPATGRQNYLIEHGTMEVGVSHHGLFSADTCKLRNANETVDIMMNAILKEVDLKEHDTCAVMISGLGNTMLAELNILYNHVYDRLTERNAEICHSYIGNFFTCLDMMGATLTIFRTNEEMNELLAFPAFPVSMSSFHFSDS